MIVALDFDGVVVRQNRRYEDLESPLEFEPGALDGLRALKNARHVLLLWSARANRALRVDPMLDPLARVGARKVNHERWTRMQPINAGRYEQMVMFVTTQLPDIFDAIDDGLVGKPIVDLFIDDRALRFGQGIYGIGWRGIVAAYGEIEFTQITDRNPP